MAALKDPELSIVTTLFQSSPYIREFYARTMLEVHKLRVSYEFVIVNDGSPDSSLDIALELQEQDENVVVVDLSRNFGHHKAILQGLAISRGNQIFLIDCDLEEPPELLADLAASFVETHCDVAYGLQLSRKGGSGERFFGWWFYKLLNYLADVKVPPSWTIARLMSRRYVDALLRYREESVFLGGIMTTVGFKQVAVPVHKLHKGSTTYTLGRKLSAAVTAITSFSEKPLLIAFHSGLVIAISSFGFAIWFAIQRLIYGTSIDGFTTLIVSIWLIGGLLMLFLGLIGIYLAKIFLQTKNRPLTVVRQIYRRTL